MSNESNQPLPPNGRLLSAGMAGVAAIGLLINHFMIESHNVGKLMILCLGPIAFFIGIGGIVEPKILWSVGNFGKHLPMIYKLIGGALGALGVAVTLLLLLFVYRLGPPEPKPFPRLPKPAATAAKTDSRKPDTALTAGHSIVPQDVMYLTYVRAEKRWEKMGGDAAQGVRQAVAEGTTTLHYAEGEHALLKVLWPDVLEVGDRFTAEVKGANSLELVDLDGADANARSSLPATDTFIKVEIVREKHQITFTCNGQAAKPIYASGKLRGDDAKSALLATSLRAGFTVKKGAKASFQNAKIARP